AGGFARYSVDGEWFAPHFEKMLYDNGQLLGLYAKAYQVTGEDFYQEKIRETVSWLQDEMLQEEGGFFSALDADSEGKEGKFYVWTNAELEELISEDLGWFSELYNIKPEGNWEDGTNILFQTKEYEEIAKKYAFEIEEFKVKRSAIKDKLKSVRAE